MSEKEEETVRFNVQMSRKLREDAKRNTDRGELSEETRNLFRRKAYGIGSSAESSELDQAKAELREARNNVDQLRHERSMLDAKIESEESRVARLEERIDNLEEERNEMQTKVDMLENMLHNGERMWPVRIKNAADVDIETATKLYDELQDRNDELPEEAFEEPDVSTPANWMKEANGYDEL